VASRHLSPHGHEVVRHVNLVQCRPLVDFDLSSWGCCTVTLAGGEAHVLNPWLGRVNP
jgi:hypothetical protein